MNGFLLSLIAVAALALGETALAVVKKSRPLAVIGILVLLTAALAFWLCFEYSGSIAPVEAGYFV